MIINASKKKRAHWQSKSVRGNRTWNRDSNSRHLLQARGGLLALVHLLLSPPTTDVALVCARLLCAALAALAPGSDGYAGGYGGHAGGHSRSYAGSSSGYSGGYVGYAGSSGGYSGAYGGYAGYSGAYSGASGVAIGGSSARSRSGSGNLPATSR